MNPHKNMQLVSIWFKKGEFNKLINAIENNDQCEVFNILFWIKERGDLKQ